MDNNGFNTISVAEKKLTFQDTHYDEAQLNEALTALSQIKGGGKMAMDMIRGYAEKMARFELHEMALDDHEFQEAWTIGTGISNKFDLMKAVGDLQHEFEDEGISKLSREIKASFAAGMNNVLEEKYPDLDMSHKWQGPSNMG